jgi:MFS family permease
VQRRNVLYVALDGAAVGLMSAAASFISVYVVRLGASPFWVSMLSSLPAAIRLVMAIPWSQFAERQTRPYAVFAWSRLAVHVVYPTIAIIPFFLEGEAAAIAIVIVWSLSAFPSSLSNMMFTVVMGQAVPPEQRSFLMSRRWTALGIAKVISVPLAGQLIDRAPFHVGYQVVFAMNAIIALFAFYFAMRIQVPEREPASTPKGEPLGAHIREAVGEVWREKPFVTFVTGRAVLNLGLALVAAIIPIYWVDYLHASDVWVGYFTATLSAATLISYTPWVRVKRKIGTRRTLVSSAIGVALYPALLSLTRTPVAVLPAIAFNGLAAGGLNLAFFDSLLDVCPFDRRERFVAVNMTAVSLMGVIGPPIGAALLNVIGIHWVLAIGSAVALAGVAVFAVFGRGRQLPAPQAEPGADSDEVTA